MKTEAEEIDLFEAARLGFFSTEEGVRPNLNDCGAFEDVKSLHRSLSPQLSVNSTADELSHGRQINR